MPTCAFTPGYDRAVHRYNYGMLKPQAAILRHIEIGDGALSSKRRHRDYEPWRRFRQPCMYAYVSNRLQHTYDVTSMSARRRRLIGDFAFHEIYEANAHQVSRKWPHEVR